MKQVTMEIKNRERFEFGVNWTRFLEVLNDERIEKSIISLTDMIGIDNLRGKRFLDIGSGSGLSSLAARKLGAQVYAFDYDPKSVACTDELKKRYYPFDSEWIIEEGNVLDTKYMSNIGKFDIVYSWGVLHHTGAMWKAIENALLTVAPGGIMFIAIYNDQGGTSRRWRKVKKLYNTLPRFLHFTILVPVFIRLWGPAMVHDLLCGKPFYSWRNYSRDRGMSAWYDLKDWVGGYPFEVAKPENIIDFFHKNGFQLVKLKTCGGGLGCNEYVFKSLLA